MNLPEGTHLAYIVVHEAWYSMPPNDVRIDKRPTLTVCASAEGQGGGVAWEFELVHQLGKVDALQLKMFSDSWDALKQIPEFFEGLTRIGRTANIANVRALLDELGAVDETQRERVNA